MKKFTLFLGALLISMVSMAAEATISFADVANRKTLTDNQQVWEQNGLIVTGNKSASTTNVADYSNPARFYQGSSLTIKCTLGNITKIVIDGNTAKPVEAIQTSIGEEATIDGNIVTVIPKNQTSDTYVIEKFSAQVRINAITVTYTGNGETPDDGGEEPETPDTPEEPETPEVETVGDGTEANPFTVEDVIALNNTLSGKHYVKAYIVGQAVGQSFVDGLDTEAPFVAAEGSTQGTNLAIASSLTAEVANIIPVQLPKGALRDDFNLVENPDKLGAQVLICGDLIKYFNLPGIKNTTSIVVVGETPDDGGETPDDGGETPEDAKVTFAAASDKGNSTSDSNNAAEYTITKNGVTMVVSQGVVTDHYRIYKNQTLTISAAGKTITSIEITCTVAGEEKYGPGCFVTETPSYTYSEKIGTWTGEATEVTFTASLNQVRATQIVVTVAETSEDFVATPVISGEADFMENTTVTITAEEGLEVYYTLDGTDPTKASNKYTAPFELTATTTVKAIAYDATKDKASAVVEKVFSKMTVLTCEEAVALCTNPPTPGQHIIRGYITEVQEAYNEQYKNITFWMADAQDGENTLLAFRVKPVSDVEKTLKEGDFVEVIGSLILYSKDGVDTPEVNAGGSVELINAAPSAVDNITINQNATKFIKNGQLFIVKDGVRYNALGQVIK